MLGWTLVYNNVYEELDLASTFSAYIGSRFFGTCTSRKHRPNASAHLFWHVHRCARIIFSLKFDLVKMTADESINFLVDPVGFERVKAVGEVRRSFAANYGVLYRASYLLGGMQL